MLSIYKYFEPIKSLILVPNILLSFFCYNINWKVYLSNRLDILNNYRFINSLSLFDNR